MRPLLIAIAHGLLSLCVQAQWINQPTPGIPRTPEGKVDLAAPPPKTANDQPDFSGLWAFRGAGGGISQLKPTEIKPWAEALHKQRDEDLGSDSPGAQCLPSGFILGGIVKVVQTPELIVILADDLEYRQVFLDGRELPKDPNPAWMGYSVGHWDGDALVVESTGYNERTWLESGYPHTEHLRNTERWSRQDFGHLSVEIAHSDPEIYAKPWTSKVAGVYTPDTDLIEYVCAENEKDRIHLVGKRSDDSKKAVKLAPDVLSKYVGTYELRAKELTSVDLLELKIAMEDGELRLGVADGPKQAMVPLSEVTFTGFGGYVDFGKNEKGETTYLVIRMAEGDFRANRKQD
jgi:hypothetical protein